MFTSSKLLVFLFSILIYLYGCGFSGNESNVGTNTTTSTDTTTSSDKTAPVIAEVTFVSTPTSDTTPDYIFSSNEAGANP